MYNTKYFVFTIIEIELDKINVLHLFCARDDEKVMNRTHTKECDDSQQNTNRVITCAWKQL